MKRSVLGYFCTHYKLDQESKNKTEKKIVLSHNYS